jgi:hypothetical protein
MKTYRSHKLVKAAKIVAVSQDGQAVELTLETGNTRKHLVNNPLLARHDGDFRDLVGWYVVEYQDGSQSLSPGKAFEEGYHPAASPSLSGADIEAEIKRKGLTAPRITPDDIEAQILTTQYHVFAGTTLTVCCLTLRNGFQVTGESACASPENFDAELGERIAFQNARQKIWALEGYRLRSKLAAAE